MFYQYPAIGDENIFQHFCKDVYNEIYDTNDFQLYKTKGAAQHGIDAYSLQFQIVIQSKKKKLLRSDKELENELQSDLLETAELIKNLPFSFRELIFATNTKKYGSVENLAATISQSVSYQVKFVSWEELEFQITKFPNLRKDYFPNFYQANDTFPKILSQLPQIDSSAVIGRNDDLKSLENIISSAQKPVLINGIGGIGKTTLLKYALHQTIELYDHILWIDFVGNEEIGNNENQLIEVFSQNQPLLNNLNITTDGELSSTQILSLIQNKLVNISGQNILLIDNAPQAFSRVSAWLPGSPGWKVLLSSRENIPGCLLFDVPFLAQKRSSELFYQYFQLEHNDQVLNEILDFIGYHTLTIELLSKTANKRRITLPELWNALSNQGLNISKTAKVTTDHDPSQRPVNYFDYLLSIFSIANLDNGQQYILSVLCIIPSEFITYDNLKLVFQIGDDDNEFFENISILAETGWLIRIDDKYQIHQVIQEVIRDKLKPSASSCKQTIDRFNSILLVDFGKNPLKVKKMVDYAEGLLNYVHDDSPDFASLYNALGLRNEDFNNFDKAISFYLKSEEIYGKCGVGYEADVAGVYNNLQSVHKTLGQIDTAFNYQLRAISIQETVLHPLDLDLGSSYNNIALLYEIKGDFNNALLYMRRAVAMAEHSIQGNHAYLASSYSSLGNILNYVGEDDEAFIYQKKAYDMRLEILEEDHPQLDESRNNMAAMYEAVGELDLAEDLIRQSIAYKERIYGADSFRLGTAYNNLAAIYLKREKLDVAENFQRKAIQLEEEGLGFNHHEVATSYSTLAVIKNHQKKFNEGIVFAQKAIDIMRINFPQGHEKILMYEEFIRITKLQMPKQSTKVGRNELCPCGSQKKYKYCHGK